jgi:hypothetical protein
MTDETTPLVWSVAPGRWVLKNADSLRSKLANLSVSVGSFQGDLVLDFDASIENEADLAVLLRDLGFAFDVCPDWSPSALVAQLKKSGLVEGAFNGSQRTASGKRITCPL